MKPIDGAIRRGGSSSARSALAVGASIAVVLVIIVIVVVAVSLDPSRERAPEPGAPAIDSPRVAAPAARGRDPNDAAGPTTSPVAPAPANTPEPKLKPSRTAAPPRISGIVVEAGTGAPVARLPLTLSSPGRTSALATTRDDGTFETHAALPEGELLVIDGTSYAGLALTLDADHRNLVLARLVLIENESLENVVIEHPFSGRVAGRVVDGSGAAVPGARLFALLDARRVFKPGISGIDPDWRTATTGESGAFAFDRLPTDRELGLVAEAAGFATAFSEAFVASPHGTEVADIVLLRPGSLVLLVLDAEGTPVPGAWAGLYLIDDAGGVARTLSTGLKGTDGDGLLSTDGLYPGRYLIRAARPPHVFRGAETATIGEGERVEVTVRAHEPRLAIAGTVIDPTTGRGTGNLLVRATRIGVERATAPAATDSEGRFTVEVPESGAYRLLASQSSLDAGPAVEAMAGDKDVRLEWSLPATRFRVRVLDDATGWPISDAGALVGIEGASPEFRTTTDPSGLTVAFKARGRCAAVAAARGHAPGHAVFEMERGGRGERTIEIRLGPGRAASGRVIDADGRPVSGAIVAVVEGLLGLDATRVLTRADGSFTLDSLPVDGGEVALISAGGSIEARASAGPDEGEIVLVAPMGGR